MRAKSRKSRQHTTPARTDGVATPRLRGAKRRTRRGDGVEGSTTLSDAVDARNQVELASTCAESAPFLFLSNILAQPSTSEGRMGRPFACHNALRAFRNSNFEQFPNSRSSYLCGAFLSKRCERPQSASC
jgi:hypothetical protein